MRKKRQFLTKLKQHTHNLKKETYALFLATRDPRTPWYAKFLAAGILAYAFSPIDLIPDFIPVLGYLDDVVLIPMGILLVVNLVPHDVMSECRLLAEEAASKGKPVSWIAGAVIILIWVAIAVLLLGWMYKEVK